MGYDIYIGEGEIDTWGDNEDATTELRIRVRGMRSDNAPEFPGDEMTGKGNSRHPSYSGWANFARNVGLHDLFFGDEGGLMSSHPGSFQLTKRHHETIKDSLDRYRAAHADKVPGWDPTLKGIACMTGEGANPMHDGDLARLMWLEWWVAYALENCKTPTIYNH